jgi:hypothetical protein
MPETMAIITALILDRPLCPDCIAIKAGVGQARVEACLARTKNALTLRRDETGRCRACGTTGVVLWLLDRTDYFTRSTASPV